MHYIALESGVSARVLNSRAIPFLEPLINQHLGRLFGKLTYSSAFQTQSAKIERIVREATQDPALRVFAQTESTWGIRKFLEERMKSKRRSESKKNRSAQVASVKSIGDQSPKSTNTYDEVVCDLTSRVDRSDEIEPLCNSKTTVEQVRRNQTKKGNVFTRSEKRKGLQMNWSELNSQEHDESEGPHLIENSEEHSGNECLDLIEMESDPARFAKMEDGDGSSVEDDEVLRDISKMLQSKLKNKKLSKGKAQALADSLSGKHETEIETNRKNKQLPVKAFRTKIIGARRTLDTGRGGGMSQKISGGNREEHSRESSSENDSGDESDDVLPAHIRKRRRTNVQNSLMAQGMAENRENMLVGINSESYGKPQVKKKKAVLRSGMNRYVKKRGPRRTK